jgi:hypothetical protein
MSTGSELINNYFTKAQAVKHVKGGTRKAIFRSVTENNKTQIQSMQFDYSNRTSAG